MLKIGMKGNDVKLLQEKLGLTADGDFGPKTEKALKEWQTKNGLTPDGVAGQTTLSKLGILIKEDVVIQPVSGLNIDKLKGHIPDVVLSQISEAASKFNITTNLRLAHFLAQCSHESGGFKITNENLNYSIDGLKKIFGKYFPGNLAESYAKQPEKIASRVYGGRMGNGDEASKEGYKFRGRGYIQLTGKDNYRSFTKFIGEDCVANPDLVASKYPLASAAFFFNNNNLWSICDRGSTDEVVTSVTRRVNGGTIGLEHRLKEFKTFWKLLG
jgi:putative chitinase